VSVTINAHQLGRLLDKTSSHLYDDESNEQLNGIRLDIDARYLYAVTSDRYTLAAARYQLNHGDLNQEPWARTIPAQYLPSLREWTSAMKGASYITISTDEDRLVFAGPHTELRIAVSLGLAFPDWRGLLRTISEQTAEAETFPALNTETLAGWADSGHGIRVRITGDQKPVLVFAEDFIGAQMPARYAGVGPVTEETFESASSLWLWTLAAGAKGADMAADMPADDPNQCYEVTKDPRETGEELLKQTLHSCADMHGKSMSNPDEFHAHVSAGVHAWMAYRFLDALHTVDPRYAEQIIADTAEQLDSGEIGEFAWDAAEAAGHNPQQWHDEYTAYLKERAEEHKAAETAAPATAATA
jgi:hypothetical protein